MYTSLSNAMSLTLSALILAATALPADTAVLYPEVVPGPGMPSLAELGTTTAELYTTTPNLAFGKSFAVAAARDPECRHCPDSLAKVDSVIACYNYLNKLGTKGCKVPAGNGVEFVRTGNAKVDGLNYSAGQKKPVTSYCSDVALAVQWIFNHCNTAGQVRGSNAANGNGELIVRAQNINYDGWC